MVNPSKGSSFDYVPTATMGNVTASYKPKIHALEPHKKNRARPDTLQHLAQVDPSGSLTRFSPLDVAVAASHRKEP
jgi:hypothetical protein